MRIGIRSFRLVAASLVVGLVTFSVAMFPTQVASAAATPPVVVSSEATPSVVPAGTSVTFQWQFTSQAGVTLAGLYPLGPNNTQPGCGGSAFLLSGTAEAGTYEEVCPISSSAFDGLWTSTISMTDAAGQSVNVVGPTFTVAPTRAALVVATSSLPDGYVYSHKHKVSYSATLTASGGNPPYKWSLASGSGPLPKGLRLESTGVISGKPKRAGMYSFTIQVVDTKTKTTPHTQNKATAQLSITISQDCESC
jgi:hypothetical protein